MFTAVPDAPDAPTVSDVNKSSATVTWQPAKKDGGSPVTGYYIERMSDIANRWVQVTKSPVKETSYVDKEITEGTQYQYRIIAENKAGKSRPSEPSQLVKAKEVFGEFLEVYSCYLLFIYMYSRVFCTKCYTCKIGGF